MTTTPAGLDSIHDEVIRDIDRQMRLDREAAAPVFCSLKVTNLKVVPSMSEETIAYTATIKFGSIAIAHASNAGHGGNTIVCAVGGRHDMLRDLERRWMEAIGPDSTNCAVRFNLEAWVDDAAEAQLKAMEDKRERARIARFIKYCTSKGQAVCRVGNEMRSFNAKAGIRSRGALESWVKVMYPTACDFAFPEGWSD